jgi:hypothetical protein
MDGLKLMLEQSGDTLIQEQFYNGLMHDHYVLSVMCFCPDGTIPIVFCNIPGTVHHGGQDDLIFSAIHEKCSLKLRQDGNSS